MTRDTRMWLVIMLLGAAGLIGRAVFSEQGMGREYVHVVPAAPNSAPDAGERIDLRGIRSRAERASPAQTEYRFSAPRTVGLWVAAFFTLAVFSFLYRDNPFYKIAESVLVGVSGGVLDGGRLLGRPRPESDRKDLAGRRSGVGHARDSAVRKRRPAPRTSSRSCSV